MVRWMAPIMSFTADEIWKLLPGERSQFVFTEEWFDGLFGLNDGEAMDDAYWADLLAVRSEVNKALEAARADKRIGSSLQAEVTLLAEPALAEKLVRLGDELRFVLITSQAKVEAVTAAPADAQATELSGLWLQVAATEAAKCERCWHHVADVGTIAGHEGICGRCVTNVEGDGETRAFA
jgi:Isoleucyl-tRNA synthetase